MFLPFRYTSENLLGHFCVPDGSDYINKDTYEAFKKGFFESVYGAESARHFNDVIKSWPIILCAAILAVVFGYMYLFVIQYVGGLIIWGSLFATLVIIVSVGLYSYFVARPAYDPTDPTYKALEYTAYVTWALGLLLCTTACCCYNAIQVGIAVFSTTCEYVQANMHIFILPALSSMAQCIFFLIWLSAAVFIFAVGEPEPREMYPFVTEVKWDDQTKGIGLYYLFGLFWVNAFIIGCT